MKQGFEQVKCSCYGQLLVSYSGNFVTNFAAPTQQISTPMTQRFNAIPASIFGVWLLLTGCQPEEVVPNSDSEPSIELTTMHLDLHRISIVSVPESGDAFVVIIKDEGEKTFQTEMFGHGFADKNDLEISIPDDVQVACGHAMEWCAFAYYENNHEWEIMPLGAYTSFVDCSELEPEVINFRGFQIEVDWVGQ